MKKLDFHSSKGGTEIKYLGGNRGGRA